MLITKQLLDIDFHCMEKKKKKYFGSLANLQLFYKHPSKLWHNLYFWVNYHFKHLLPLNLGWNSFQNLLHYFGTLLLFTMLEHKYTWPLFTYFESQCVLITKYVFIVHCVYWVYVCVFCTLSSVQSVNTYCPYVKYIYNIFALSGARS